MNSAQEIKNTHSLVHIVILSLLMQLVSNSDLLDIWKAAIVDLTRKNKLFTLDICHTISFAYLVTPLIEINVFVLLFLAVFIF